MLKPQKTHSLHRFTHLSLSLSLLLIVGCTTPEATNPNPQPSANPNPDQTQQPTPPSNTETPEEPLKIAQNGENFKSGADSPNYLRDYEPTQPLPTTGKVTIRRDVRELDTATIFSNCPTDTAPYAYAESSNYEVLICSEQFDPSVPKTYIGAAKDGSGSLRIESQDRAAAYQLIFQNNDYTYSIYRDGARPESLNAYLEVTQPNGKTYAEALLYLYEYIPRR